MWVSVKKIDRSWRKDVGFHIGCGGTKHAIAGRYRRFGRWIRRREPIWMPAVCLGDEDIAFTDGRHRFAWLRDHGVRFLPVQVPPEEANAIRERFGAAIRKSKLVQSYLGQSMPVLLGWRRRGTVAW